MEEKKKNDLKDKTVLQDPENIIKSTEADTETIVDFMHEEIKKRPVNHKKILQRARETMVIAVLFGTVSCLVFAILLPIINNALNPGEETTQTVTLPEEKPSEELTPEDMVENDRKKEASEEKQKLSEELDALLDEKIIGVEQYKRISASLQNLAKENAGMIAAVSGITSDTDWFNDSYENRDTTAGLVTKKTDTEIFILVQSRRIEDAQKILVTFHDGTEAEAQIKSSDSITGLSVLSVPLSSVPAENRAVIKEAAMGTSVNTILTGAPVIAIGSPTGTLESVIYGNVTGSGESLEIADNYLCRITTDIYGSSDATGFLINLDGEVVGMIDMRYKDSNVPNMLCGIGISELRPIIRRLEEGGTKAYLGVSGIDVTQEISDANEIPLGVWVTHVEEDSPAMAAGIQKGDVITGVGKNDILTMAGLTIQLTQTEPGETVTLRIMRRNGGSFEEIKVSVTAQ
jgi:S1-C subfamily serine protease